jgi:tetratricopeptide (TPR) repeat protein
MNLQEFLLSINGCATLVANNGTFLGVISSNQNDSNSVCNPHGQYGSPHAFNSVRNEHGIYGGSHGMYSPYNPHCLHPPVIVYNGRVVLVVTRNTNLISFAYGTQLLSGIPIVDPDLLFAVYGCLGSTGTTTSFQDEYTPTHISSQPYFTPGMPSYSQAQVQINNAEDWFIQGNELLNSQRYEEAITSYERAIQSKLDLVEAWYNRGVALMNLQQNEDAFVSFDRAVQLKSDFCDAWFNRGLTLFNLKRYEESVASFDRVIQLKPDIAEVWLFRGSALGELQRYAEALVCCDRAIQLKSELIECWSVRGIVLTKLQQHEEAIVACDKVIQQKPDNPIGWYSKACCYALQGNIELAIKSLKWAVEIDTKYREIAKTDLNLDAIREDERFQQIIDG